MKGGGREGNWGEKGRDKWGVRSEGSGWSDRGPFIVHARADRELAPGDTVHKSEAITPC